jgi:hypothetical protein
VCGGIEAGGGWLSLWIAGDGQRLAGAAAVMRLLAALMAS